MADDAPNLPLIIKLLKMTTSNNDGEALTAIRKANEQLLKFGGDWEKLLRGKVTIIADPFSDPRIPEPDSNPRQHSVTQPPRPAPPPSPHAPRNTSSQQRPWVNPAPSPPKPKPQPRHVQIQANKFSGNCWCCGTHVAAGLGTTFKPLGPASQFKVQCLSCLKGNTPIPKVAARPQQAPSLADVLKNF